MSDRLTDERRVEIETWLSNGDDETLLPIHKRTLRSLLSEIEALRKERDEARAGLRAIGAHACQKLPEPCGKDGYRCTTCHARFILGESR